MAMADTPAVVTETRPSPIIAGSGRSINSTMNAVSRKTAIAADKDVTPLQDGKVRISSRCSKGDRAIVRYPWADSFWEFLTAKTGSGELAGWSVVMRILFFRVV